MAQHFERVFIQHLCVPSSLKEIIERELPNDLLPSEDLGQIFVFCQDYWHAESTDGIAPTPEVLLTHFANLIAEHEIDLTIDPEGTLNWCIEVLQGVYIDRKWQPWMREFAMKISGPDVDPLGKAAALDDAVQHLMGLQSMFTRRSEQVEMVTQGAVHIDAYAERAANASLTGIRGAVLGLRQFGAHETLTVDEATGGTRPGELTIVAGPPKSGKSFLLANGAWEHFRLGGDPVLITLENGVEMTQDRVVCMVAHVDANRWDRGECDEAELARIAMYRDLLTSASNRFHIIQPEPGKRTAEHLIRRARTLGDAIYIDQLTFIEPSPGSERKQRYQQVGDSLHEMKSLISSGNRIPVVLAHQINREGVKAAEKTGHLEMYHLAESAEVERTADRVFGLWQSPALRDAGRAWLQQLAARRSDLVHWEIRWRPYMGDIAVLNEMQLPESA